jgi:chromosome segregation ATPase
MAAASLNGAGAVFVTRDGDLLSPGRVISGGSGAHHAESDAEIDMRKRKAALDDAARAAAEAEADHEELIRRYEWARLAYRDDADALKAARAAVTEAERAANDIRSALARTEQQLALAEANRAGAARRIAEVANLAAAANAR